MRRHRFAAALAVLSVTPPAAASAAVVDGNVYRAVPGETNSVQMTDISFRVGEPMLEWLDYRAPLTAGAGCSGIGRVICAGATALVYLGDRNDVADVNPIVGSNTKVYGEAGDDDFLAGGRVQAFGYGGPGNDTIRFNVGGGAFAEGGPGMTASARSIRATPSMTFTVTRGMTCSWVQPSAPSFTVTEVMMRWSSWVPVVIAAVSSSEARVTTCSSQRKRATERLWTEGTDMT